MDDQKWTANDVQRVVCNPIYSGIPPFPRIVEDDRWISAATNAIKEMGARRFLRTMLEELRNSQDTSREPFESLRSAAIASGLPDGGPIAAYQELVREPPGVPREARDEAQQGDAEARMDKLWQAVIQSVQRIMPSPAAAVLVMGAVIASMIREMHGDPEAQQYLRELAIEAIDGGHD